MSCRLVKRYMGGSTKFDGTSSVITVPSPMTLPTDAFSVSWRYKSNLPTSGFASNEGFFHRTGSLEMFKQATNDVQVYAYLNAPTDYATPRRLRFRGFKDKEKDNNWHTRSLVFYVVGGSAKCDEYVDGYKYGATHTVDYTGDANSPTGDFRIGRTSAGWFNGKLSELIFTDRALTAQECLLFHLMTLPSNNSSFFPLSDLPSTYLDTIGGATGTGTATTYSPDVPTQLPVAIDTEARSSLKNGATNTDCITVENSAGEVTDNISDQTFEVEFMPSQLQGGTRYLLSIPRITGNNRRYLQLSATNLIGYNLGSTSSTLTYGANPLKWHVAHLVVDATAQTADIWLNGQRIAKAIAFTVGTGTSDIIFGNQDLGATSALIGYIKTGRVWRQKLTDQEIKDRVFSGVIPYKNQPSILTCDLRMNEGAGTTAYDSSGNGNNATISGATWSASVPSKAREVIGGNLVKNGSFEYVPRVNVEQTTSTNFINGTVTGSNSIDLFGATLIVDVVNTSAVFDTSVLTTTGKPTIKIDCDATGRGRFVIGSKRQGTGASLLLSNLTLKVKPSTTYLIKYDMQAIDTLGASGITVHFYDSVGTRRTQTTMNTLASGSLTMSTRSTTFTTSSTDRFIVLSCGLGTAGQAQTVWIGDISLTETTLPTRTTTTTRTTLTCP